MPTDYLDLLKRDNKLEIDKNDHRKVLRCLFALKYTGWLFDEELESILTRNELARPWRIPASYKVQLGSELLARMAISLNEAGVMSDAEFQEVWHNRRGVYDYYNMPKKKS